MNGINEILKERGTNYGPFTQNAESIQALKGAMKSGLSWNDLSPDKKEALEMIAHKIGRIVNGDTCYLDNWDDIAGYAILISNEIKSTTTP